MILYFSGTGNSKYVAEQLALLTDNELVSLPERMRKGDYTELHSDKPWVLVAPIYAWNLPKVVTDYLKKLPMTGTKEIYFVVTCGGSCGNVAVSAAKLAEDKGLHFMGSREVIMPDNYIIMFQAPTEAESRAVLAKAGDVIAKIADAIRDGKELQSKTSLTGALLSKLVNRGFNSFAISDKAFYATDSCIGCGLCEKNCPLANIKMANGKPQWQGHCTQCMACIGTCPQKAIEYGKKTVGKDRYLFQKSLLK